MHRAVEALIGRLITDEAFRRQFLEDPAGTLMAARVNGIELTPTEIAALIHTNRAVWILAAAELDPRLQKVSLTNEEMAHERGH